ncbi:hypothetical protein GCM10023186_09830 [Hymenobacter koreensis]|uniref:Uncharacterized protein n=2 Tax=Hymenobacter koreensis TaxID=1084523 RepID=A0ABP8IVW7_9BACT
MAPKWIFDGRGFIEDATPAIKVQALWQWRNNTELTAFARTGTWASEKKSSYSYSAGFEGYVYQAGTGLRYTDFVNLGPWLEPFVGLNASVGYVGSRRFYSQSDLPNNPWNALAGAEIGVQSWLTRNGGPTLTLEFQRSLLPYHAPFTRTKQLWRPAPLPPEAYTVRHRSLPGHAALLVGWRWQLPQPRPRWNTPRYSETAETDE